GRILKSRGLNVSIQKHDPYLNVDAGTMSPFQHGEAFVTEDGAETDLDLGHYERFIDVNLTKDNSVTTGKIYNTVISKERHGDFLGKTVQIIPHVTDEIKASIKRLNKAGHDPLDVIIVEIGGTIGDIEGLPFLEAIRQFRNDIGRENVLYIHVSFFPYLKAAKEIKSKPTQHSIKELRGIGIQPDILICRSQSSLTDTVKEKISLFCDIPKNAIIETQDVDSIYEVPIVLEEQKLGDLITDLLKLTNKKPDLKQWREMVYRLHHPDKKVTIGVIGKYIRLKDAYMSINEALIHGGIYHNCKVEIKRIDSDQILKNDIQKTLKNLHGILIPGGFGVRGIEGKIQAIQYARERKIPFMGICLGMQCALVEFARHKLGMAQANSMEFDADTEFPIFILMEKQLKIADKGGTMRLGSYDCHLDKNSLAYQIYQKEVVQERHRHRYEFNNLFLPKFEQAGIMFSGMNQENNLVEVIELKDHPWFVGMQFHPEFKSRPSCPHPMFKSFIGAAIQKSQS
ncbi:MAG: CTP synthase, partial [Candidatus Atribacteria bacterium]|nr:CTP synthase [Candidatus Atribacteria bacterium]